MQGRLNENPPRVLSLPKGPDGHRPGAVSLLWRQHDRLPHPQRGQPPGGLHRGEMVHGEADSTETRLGPAGGGHDGMFYYFCVESQYKGTTSSIHPGALTIDCGVCRR